MPHINTLVTKTEKTHFIMTDGGRFSIHFDIDLKKIEGAIEFSTENKLIIAVSERDGIHPDDLYHPLSIYKKKDGGYLEEDVTSCYGNIKLKENQTIENYIQEWVF